MDTDFDNAFVIRIKRTFGNRFYYAHTRSRVLTACYLAGAKLFLNSQNDSEEVKRIENVLQNRHIKYDKVRVVVFRDL